MSKSLENNTVNKFQGALGLVVLVAAGIWAWCQMTGLNSVEGPIRAQSEAVELAQVVLDYRSDTGKWPRNSAGQPDLTPLLGRRAARQAASLAHSPGGGMGGLDGLNAASDHLGEEKSWLRELPLDPWGRAFQVHFTESRVAIVSRGPDGVLDTDPNRLWSRPGNINPGDGDDVCAVLDFDHDGGPR